MYFGSKGAEMREATSGMTYRQDIKTAMVVLPLDLKISGERYHNSRPYLTLGGMATFDVSKKRSEYLQFNTSDFYLSVGLGLTDILRHDRPDLDENPEMYKITQSLSKVKSKMFVLTFYFE